MNIKQLTRSTGKKRSIGAFIVMVPMIVKYVIKLSNAQAGTNFEIDDDLLNILFGVGTLVWSGGVMHAYLPKVLRITTVVERSLETFNEWAKKALSKDKK